MTAQQLKKNIGIAVELIKKSKRIILACHMNPDGDAIGSMLAFGHGLKKIGKTVIMLCPDKVPYRYDTLPGARSIKQRYNRSAELAISIDCGSLSQLASLERVFEESKRIIEIDHHEYRTRFGDIQIIDRRVAAVGEIIRAILLELKIPVDKKIAECLLTSALVETSSFSRQEVNPATFEFCSQLMRLGIDFHRISERYYWQKKLSAAHLSGLCLARVKTKANKRLAWSILYRKDFEKFRGSQEDVDPVPDDMMLIEDVQVVLLFREIANNMLRVSLRSSNRLDIGHLATLYGGGGHHNLAGCRIHNNRRTIERFINQACNLIYKNKREM